MQDEPGISSQSEWTHRIRFRNKYATNKYHRCHIQKIIKPINYILHSLRLTMDGTLMD